jgi:hypothetical protein
MRRRKLLLTLAGLAVVVAVGAVALWPGSGAEARIALSNVSRIHSGTDSDHRIKPG